MPLVVILNKIKSVYSKLARLRRSKNSNKLTKESLITSLSKSEISYAERAYMKQINNNTNHDNNDDTYNKIRDKISDIRMILGRLGNTITKNDRKLKKSFMK